MKRNRFIVLLACLAAFNVHADYYLDGRQVTRSDYYNGVAGSARLDYISLVDWLEYRRESGRLENAVLTSGAFILDDPAMLEPMYDLANSLLASWPGTVPKTAIFFQAGSTTSYDAVTTAENEIIIQVGTLSNAYSMDEIAAILAHELSHILLGHNTKLNYLAKGEELFSQYAKVKTLVTNIETLSYDGEQLQFIPGPEYVRKIRKIERNQELAFRFYTTAYATIHSRGDEIEADRLATDLLMNVEELHPSALMDMFDKLSSSYRVNRSIEKQVMTQTTDLVDQYAAEIQSLAVSGDGSVQSGEQLANQLSDFNKSVKDRITDLLAETLLGFLGARHPVPQQRRVDFNDYARNEAGYQPDRINAGSSPETLDAYKATPEVSRALANVESGMKALDYANTGMMTQALEQLATMSSLGLIEDPFGTYVSYQVYRIGEQDDAALETIKQLSQYFALPILDALQISEFLLEQKGTESSTQVREIIRQKEEYLGTIPNFYPLKIQLAKLDNDAETALALAVECITLHADIDELYQQCLPDTGVTETRDRGMFDGIINTLDTFSEATQSALE